MATKHEDLNPTRSSLLSRLRNWDDQESWKEFFDTYWKLLYSVAIKSGLTDAEAQDVVQETVLTVAKKMPDFKYDPEVGSFKAWLMLIARRRVIDYTRKRQREPQRHHSDTHSDGTSRTSTLERQPDPDADKIDAIYEEEWQKSVVEKAIARLKRKVDPKQFQIFDLYALKNWPIEEVAKQLNATHGQIYTAKHRVAVLLKEEVQRLQTSLV